MSFSALYEYMHGEFQDVTRVPLAAAGVDPAWVIDPNGVKIAGHQIELWDAETGGTQLLEGVDYSLVFLDSGKTAAEGVDIWAGYQVINVAYQGIPLYITARIIGGYTMHAEGRIIFDEPIGDQWVTKWDTGRMEINLQYNSGETGTVTFAEPFIGAAPRMFATCISSPGNRVVTLNTVTLGGFLYNVYIADTGDSATTRFSWQAIGRWK